ncbi:Hypothetical predicted protein [Lecanosticta acicola]|uniref:Uncharacterized protein n=1 Tax=Lecanosticta acicola TaxID=111012 RepID=A0AAI9EFB3_9PEZI|nr:Hypothetical predicted protein [Lecanosticta acicola]
MASPLVNLPLEIRDLVTANIISQNQPLLHNTSCRRPSIPYNRTTSTSSTPSTQQPTLHSEYARLMRRAAFTPNTKTKALIYNCDFREMISFVKSLRSSEIAAANRCQSLMLNVMVFGLRGQSGQRLLEWVKLCEEMGLGLEYMVQWMQCDAVQLESLEGVLGRYQEGRKILAGLKAAVKTRR